MCVSLLVRVSPNDYEQVASLTRKPPIHVVQEWPNSSPIHWKFQIRALSSQSEEKNSFALSADNGCGCEVLGGPSSETHWVFAQAFVPAIAELLKQIHQAVYFPFRFEARFFGDDRPGELPTSIELLLTAVQTGQMERKVYNVRARKRRKQSKAA